MTDSPDPYVHFDAAYVAGALSPQERRDYEQHMKHCGDCAEAVAELAGLPGLLSMVPPEEVREPASDPGPVPETVLPRLVATLRQRRRRRRGWTAAGAVAAAACLVAVLVLGLGGLRAVPDGGTAMVEVRPVPVQATLRLQEMPWGTRLRLHCHYEGDAQPPPDTGRRLLYKLVVVPLGDGRPQQVASWGVAPGQDATPVGSTDLPVDRIGTVRLESADGTVLLRASPTR